MHPQPWNLTRSWGWCSKRAAEPQLLHAAVQKPGKTSLQQHPRGTVPCREATRGIGRAQPQEGCFLGEILFPSPLAPVIPGSNRIPLSPYESSCRAQGSHLEQPWSVKTAFVEVFPRCFSHNRLIFWLRKRLLFLILFGSIVLSDSSFPRNYDGD